MRCTHVAFQIAKQFLTEEMTFTLQPGGKQDIPAPVDDRSRFNSASACCKLHPGLKRATISLFVAARSLNGRLSIVGLERYPNFSGSGQIESGRHHAENVVTAPLEI